MVMKLYRVGTSENDKEKHVFHTAVEVITVIAINNSSVVTMMEVLKHSLKSVRFFFLQREAMEVLKELLYGRFYGLSDRGAHTAGKIVS